MQCEGSEYDLYTALAWTFSVLYVAGVPLSIVGMLWGARAHIRATKDDTPFVQSLTFYYEAYNVGESADATKTSDKNNSEAHARTGSKWFCLWDVWDMLRRLFLTSLILFIGEESFTQLTVGVAFAFMALCMHLQFKPFHPTDKMGHYLQIVSLSSIAGVLLIGVGLRGQQATEGAEAESVDNYGLGMLLIVVSVLTLIGVVGVVVWHAYNNRSAIKQWFKTLFSRLLSRVRAMRNPSSCCARGNRQSAVAPQQQAGPSAPTVHAIVGNPVYDSSVTDGLQAVSEYIDIAPVNETFGFPTSSVQ